MNTTTSQSNYLMGSLSSLSYLLNIEHPKFNAELFEIFRPEFQQAIQLGWNKVQGNNHSVYIFKEEKGGYITTLSPMVPEEHVRLIPNQLSEFHKGYIRRYLSQLESYFQNTEEEKDLAKPYFESIESHLKSNENSLHYKTDVLNELQRNLINPQNQIPFGNINECIYDYLDLKQPGIIVQNILYYAIDSISEYFSKEISNGDLFVNVWEFKKIFIFNLVETVELILKERQGLPLPLFLKYTSLAYLYAKVCQYLIYPFSPEQKKKTPELDDAILQMEDRISGDILPHLLYLACPFYYRNSIDWLLDAKQIHEMDFDQKEIKQTPDFYERIRKHDFSVFPKSIAQYIK